MVINVKAVIAGVLAFIVSFFISVGVGKILLFIIPFLVSGLIGFTVYAAVLKLSKK